MADFDFKPDAADEFDFQPDEPVVDTSRLGALEAEQARLEKERAAAEYKPGVLATAATKFAQGLVPGFEQLVALGQKGGKTYEQSLAETSGALETLGEQRPIVSGISRTAGAVAPFLATGPLAAATRLPAIAAAPAAAGAIAGGQALGQTAGRGLSTGEVAAETAKGAAVGAAIPVGFGLAGKAAQALAPTAESALLGTALRRTGQAAVRTAPVGAMAAGPVQTLSDPTATAEEKAAAFTELTTLGVLPAIDLARGTQRAALRKTKPLAERARREGMAYIEAEQAKAGEKAIAEQRKLEAGVEAERLSAAEKVIKQKRAAENEQYEAQIEQLTRAELENRKRAEQAQSLEQKNAFEEQVRQNREERAVNEARFADNLAYDREHYRRLMEDDQLAFAQREGDLKTESKLWNDKNKRAFQAVQEEQRVMSDAARLAAKDQAAIVELQQELAAVRALEERLQTDADPSLQGMVAKKFQDTYNRLNTAMDIMREGKQEIPQAYIDTFGTIAESYRRNTEKGGYVGFGPETELFIQDPIQWKEGQKAKMIAKAQAEGSVLDQRILDALDAIANSDYTAKVRAARAKPNVPESRLQEIFADQDLQYTGGDLFNKDGTRVLQPFVGSRYPNAPFTSAQALEASITRRRYLQEANERIREMRRDARKERQTIPTTSFLERQARLAALKAAAPSTGEVPKEVVRQQMEAATPRPAGMTEADILAAEGIPGAPAPAMSEAAIRARANLTPAEAQREFAAMAEAGRREVEYGTPAPGPETLRRVDLESIPRAVWETMTPDQIRLFSRIRGPGALLGGRVAEKETPSFMGERSMLDPRESRLANPFQAFAVQEAFTKALERNLADTSSKWARFKAAAETAGRFASLQEFLRQNPDVAAAVRTQMPEL